MLNEKQVIFNTYLLTTKMRLSKNNNNIMLITLLITVMALCEVALSDGSDLVAEDMEFG